MGFERVFPAEGFQLSVPWGRDVPSEEERHGRAMWLEQNEWLKAGSLGDEVREITGAKLSGTERHVRRKKGFEDNNKVLGLSNKKSDTNWNG